MKFSEYAKKMNALLETDPEYGDFEIVSSTEDCRYVFVENGPSAVYVDSEELIPDYLFEEMEISEPNAVCLNDC